MRKYLDDILSLKSGFKTEMALSSCLSHIDNLDIDSLRDLSRFLLSSTCSDSWLLEQPLDRLRSPHLLYKYAYIAYHVSDLLRLRKCFEYTEANGLWSPELRQLAILSHDSLYGFKSAGSLSVAFVDYWGMTGITKSFIVWGLTRLYEQNLRLTVPCEADICFCGPYTSFAVFNNTIRSRPRIFWSSESDQADMTIYDASVSCSNTDPTLLNIGYSPWFGIIEFFPGDGSLYGSSHYVMSFEELYSDPVFNPNEACNYDISVLMSNPVPSRIALVSQLEQRRYKILKAGRVYNRPVHVKSVIMRQSSANICSENKLQRGYITEKPFESLLYGCLPIYDGHRSVQDILNLDLLISQEHISTKQSDLVDHIASITISSFAKSLAGQRIFRKLPCFIEHVDNLRNLLTALTL